MTILQSAIAQSAAGATGYQISRSLRFNSADSAYLTRTPATTSNQKTYTWSGWVKRGTLGAGGCMFGAGNSGTNFCNLIYESSTDKISWFTYEGSTSTNLVTTQVFRDVSAWYHVVLAVDTTQATSTNRAKIYVNGVQITAFGTATYPAQNTNNVVNTAQIPCGVGAQMSPSPAVFFNGYMTEVNFIDGQQLDPTSFGATDANTGVWNPIAYTGTYGTNGFYLPYSDNAGADSFGIGIDFSASALNRVELGNTTVGYTVLGTMTYAAGGAAEVNLRDNNPNTAAADSNGIAANTAMGYDFGRAIKIRKITTLTAATSGMGATVIFNIQYSDNNSTWTTITGSTTTHTISSGTAQSNSTSFDDNGSHRYWRLIYLSGTTGGNCWIATLDMFINSIGPNSWFPVNFSVTAGVGNDSLVDTPTNYGTDTGIGGEVRGNYCTLNPLDRGSDVNTVVNGNLDATWTSNNGHSIRSTISVSSGKWYWEFTNVNNLSAGVIQQQLKIVPSSGSLWPGSDGFGVGGSFAYRPDNGNKTTNSVGTAYGATFTTTDVIGCALDMDNGKIWWSKNGTWQASGDPAAGTNEAYSGLSGTFSPAWGYINAGNNTLTANFGQRAFAYTAPSGFKALCSQNLATPTVGATSSTLANKNFDAILYTGTGASLSVTSLAFQPDFTWIKGRSGATDHALYDAVRGVQKDLVSNSTAAETTQAQGVTAFGSTGFTVGTLAKVNTSSATYVGWNWKGANTTVSNTSGSITSTVSVNPTAGISIVSYTGTGATATIGHGLGVAPKMIIWKNRSAVDGWPVWHTNLTNFDYYLLLNSTAAQSNTGSILTTTAPTSTVFSVGSGTNANGNGNSIIAYAFAEVAGFSKFGSYIGNGTQDNGPFVYTGFRPRYVVVKKINSAGTNWHGYDSARSPYNYSGSNVLKPDDSAAELTGRNDVQIYLLSNSFKVIGNDIGINENNSTFIYMAFAESPFNYSRAR